jgi:type I restriction-modification system DNA methylase subunit
VDHSGLLEGIAENFSRERLVKFLRAASGRFSPSRKDYSHYVQSAGFADDLQKLGALEFEDGRRLVVLAGLVRHELTSQSGKLKQYEVARKVLSAEHWDAGIFVFHDSAGHFRFSWITVQYTGSRREFSSFRRYTYYVRPAENQNRTFIAQIGRADFSSVEKITEAFSVEPVTKEFFREYRRIFEEAEGTITLDWTNEKKRLYTQRFFNRVMFLAFLERKGWLDFNGRRDYLKALFADYHQNEPEKPAGQFHRSRLNTLFFWGLNNPRGDERETPGFQELKRRIGEVPYLNGGLFDQEADDEAFFFPDPVAAKILAQLVYQFNFTVTESTPLDVEVAVDPEMLGRIFEELVTGRHESGSYYTPKPVVAFMCREALKGYLETAVGRNSFRPDDMGRNEFPGTGDGESAEAITLFVDKNDSSLLRNPMQVVDALRAVKVCDPACGSGAYLLGMLHELLEQYAAIFSRHQKDAPTIYKTKLDIIQNNLYGVDKDDFAVNIARLRLWLSLIVDFEGGSPPPLPNLDFKIECGDSLTAPDPSGGLQPDMFRQQQVKEFLALKNAYMDVHEGSEKKKKLGKQIDELKKQIAEWAHVGRNSIPSYGFDWQVDFAEVFAPELAESTLGGKMAGLVNATQGQMELTAAPKEGGFDIVLANPPYVRQELLGDYKDLLKPIYPEVYNGLADLFVYFYARAHQLLKNGGISCFISSNKWLKAGYGEKLRQHLLDSQEFIFVADFGNLPVFQQATAYPCIFLWRKNARDDKPTKWAIVEDLQVCYDEGILEHITRIADVLPSTQFGKGKPRLATVKSATMQAKMEASGTKLTNYVNGQFFYGIKTGLNSAFVIDGRLKEVLIKQDKSSKELIKPLVVGDDLRRYEIHYRNSYYIYVEWGCEIEKYPAILAHLKQFKTQLKERPEVKEGRYPWYAMARYGAEYAHLFEKQKIMYPVISPDLRFSMDLTGNYGNDKTYFISTEDWYLLGILNSSSAFDWIKETVSPLQGGYYEFRSIYLKDLPIPDAPQKERDVVAKLAKQAQSLHTQRRKRVEKFLREIGVEPAESTSRNPLESPWSLGEEEFARRRTSELIPRYRQAREETLSLTEEAVRVEKEIDERVKGLYGV